MSSTLVFHPELRRTARVLPRGGIGPRTLPLVRQAQRLTGRRPPVDAERVVLGSASLWLLRPETNGPHPAIVWIHGGGFVLGQALQDIAICRDLARRLGAVVAAVDYRLAPEHPFPLPLDDCLTALHWLADQPFVDAERVAVAGASAGGGLAAGVALRARTEGTVRPVLQLLAYPMLDDRTATTAPERQPLRLWNNKANHFGWRSYLGGPPGSEGIDPAAAPARAGDLAELPPAWIGVGTCDLFYDEDVTYAQRLQAAGVPCQLHVVDGAFHGFDLVAPRTGVAQAFRSAQVAALARAFAG